MATTKHITRIEASEANTKTNLDHGQTAIHNDAGSANARTELEVWSNDDNSYHYYPAVQKVYDVSGDSDEYQDNTFNDVTAQGDMYVGAGGADASVYHGGDTDTRIRFPADDRVNIEAGGVSFVDFLEGATDYIEFNPTEADIDFIINSSSADSFFVEGSSGYVGVGTASPENTLDVRGTIYQTADISGSAFEASEIYVYGDDEDSYLERNYYFAEGTKASPENFDDSGTETGVIYTDKFHVYHGDAFRELNKVEIVLGGGSCNETSYWKWSSKNTDSGCTWASLLKLGYDTGLVYNEGDASVGAVNLHSNVGIVKDSAALSFGTDSEVVLMHVHDTGLRLNNTMQLQFGNSNTNIAQLNDDHLDLTADLSIDLNSDVYISGQAGVGVASHNNTMLYVLAPDEQSTYRVAGRFRTESDGTANYAVIAEAQGGDGDKNVGVYAYALNATTNHHFEDEAGFYTDYDGVHVGSGDFYHFGGTGSTSVGNMSLDRRIEVKLSDGSSTYLWASDTVS